MCLNRQIQCGFTLVEIIMVIVITGIIGSVAAVFIRAPIQQYLDIAHRAELTDIADLSMYRLESDLRAALPNSARVTSATCPVTTANPGGAGTCSFLEFLPSSDSGRLRRENDDTKRDFCNAGGTRAGDQLKVTGRDECFQILGHQVTFRSGDQVVIAISGVDTTTAGSAVDAYEGNTETWHVRRRYDETWGGLGTPVSGVYISAASGIDADPPHRRFYVVNQAVSYVCDPAVGHTLMRYDNYGPVGTNPIWPVQPTSTAVLGAGKLLANNVHGCSFGVAVNGGNNLVEISLAASTVGETAALYKVVHVGGER